MIQAFIPLLKKSPSAKIINVSSKMGSLGLASAPNSRFYKVSSLGYQSSKVAVNFATIIFAKELADTHMTVNSVNRAGLQLHSVVGILTNRCRRDAGGPRGCPADYQIGQ